jgi:tetratricopeptide (TPR) repeat protein
LAAAQEDSALDQGLASARSTIAAGRPEEAIALLETLASAAPHSEQAMTLLALARERSRSQPTIAQGGVETPLAPASTLPNEGTTPSSMPTSEPSASELTPELAAATPAPLAEPVPPDEWVPLAPPRREDRASSVTPDPVVSAQIAPAAAVLTSTGDRSATFGPEPGDQRWKIVLVLVPMVLAALAFLGYQRLTAEPGNPSMVGSQIALATPARPAEQAGPIAVPTQTGPTAVPTLTAADLFTACEAAVTSAAWAQAAESCEKVRAREALHPGLSGALATTYVALGKAQLAQGSGVLAALSYFEQAVDAQPDDAEAGLQLQRASTYRDGSTALANENWPAATERLDTLYIAVPDYLETAGDDSVKSKLYTATLKWGEALLQDGHYADAREKCQKAGDLVPEAQAPKQCIAAAVAALATPTPVFVQPQAPVQAPAPPRSQPQTQPQAPAPAPPRAPQTQPQAKPQAAPPPAAPPAQPPPQALPTRPPVPAPAVPPTRPPY